MSFFFAGKYSTATMQIAITGDLSQVIFVVKALIIKISVENSNAMPSLPAEYFDKIQIVTLKNFAHLIF